MVAARVVIVSGANRGLGLGLVERYALIPNQIVIAACRDVSRMPQVKTADGSRVITVKIDASKNDDAKTAIEELKSKHGITQIDIGIANAGLMTDDCWAKLSECSPESFEQMWRVNVLGALTFFQAVRPLLPDGGKFIFMSSGASIIDRVPDKIDAAYGITKSSDNYLARYAHFEEPNLVIFSLSPGWVTTEMGNLANTLSGSKGTLISVDTSCDGMVKVIDDATRDNFSGLHVRYDGSQSKW